MAKNQPPKKSKAAGKKAVAKRGVGKKPAPRKAAKAKSLSKAELNRRRLEEDTTFYNRADKDRLGIRTKGSYKHPRGVKLEELDTIFDSKTSKAVGYEKIGDPDIYLSKKEYDLLGKNPRAIPRYIPIYEGVDKNGKPKVKHFIRSGDRTKTPVSAHYRYRIFGRHFKEIDKDLYVQSSLYWRHQKKQRSEDLLTSYKNKMLMDGIEMNDEEINNDPIFQNLVELLISYSAEQQQFTDEYVKTIDSEIEYLNDYYGTDISEMSASQLRDLVGTNPDYQRVLVELGRRLPDEDKPVGSYGPGYMKINIEPLWPSNTAEFKEG